MGISEIIKGVSIWLFLAAVFLMLGLWLIQDSGIAKTQAVTMVMFASTVIPMFLVTFAMPSLYCDSGITKDNIAFVLQHLQTRGFCNTKQIELLKKSVKIIEERARSRVNTLKWLVGLLWAGFVYTLSKGFEQSTVSPAGLMNFILLFSSLFMPITVAYLCVWGYESALDKLFRSIEFGCNDLCNLLEVTPSEG